MIDMVFKLAIPITQTNSIFVLLQFILYNSI